MSRKYLAELLCIGLAVAIGFAWLALADAIAEAQAKPQIRSQAHAERR